MDLTPIVPSPPPDPARGAPAPAAPEAARLHEACRSFEAYFTASLLSSLTRTVPGTAGTGAASREERWAWDWLSQSVAEEMSRTQSLGLGRQLETYIKEKTGARGASPAP